MIDFSTDDDKALFEREVRKRMEEPFCMEREQAEMLVAVLLTDALSRPRRTDTTQ